MVKIGELTGGQITKTGMQTGARRLPLKAQLKKLKSALLETTLAHGFEQTDTGRHRDVQ